MSSRPTAPNGADRPRDERARRTEVSLTRWRAVAAERRAAWHVRQAELHAATRAWQVRMGRRALAVLAVGLLIVLFISWSTPDRSRDVAAHEAAASNSPPDQALPWVGAPPLPIESAAPGPVAKPPAVPVRAGSVRAWSTHRHHWVDLHIETTAPAWLRYRDANGEQALDDMRCFKATRSGHRCRAGRRIARIDHAIVHGAASGTWTVDVCTEEGCTPVSSFETTETAGTPVLHS